MGGNQCGILMLSSVVLPGGEQRRRTSTDQLQMRELFEEGDVVSAEIQNFFHDGTTALHTRSVKYGKLTNGQLIIIPNVLMRRLKQQFMTLPCGVQVLFGLNGYVWITMLEKDEDIYTKETRALTAEQVEARRKAHDQRSLNRTERLTLCRVANALRMLRDHFVGIRPGRVTALFDASIDMGLAPKDMLKAEYAVDLMDRLERANRNTRGARSGSLVDDDDSDSDV